MISVLLIAFASCSAPHYLALPSQVQCPVVQNKGSFGIQNLDEQAKVESNNLICHYEGFDIQFTVSKDFTASFTIINNTNKDLLIDKSQCYVLYNGSASSLFKDVRLSGSTTFNDVQGAINNVQTSHGSVMMTIPAYSKWVPPIIETNVRNIQELPEPFSTTGNHSLTQYDNPEPVEFIIPYSFDPTMRAWKTTRNRVYVSSVNAQKATVPVNRAISNEGASAHQYYRPSATPVMISSKEYIINKQNGIPDFSEVDRIDAINQQRYKKHNRQVKAGRVIGGFFLLPTVAFSIVMWVLAPLGCTDHLPPK